MRTPFAAAVLFFIACSAAHAEYAVAHKGLWPETWPKELEPLRSYARTLVGPKAPYRHYLIPFTKREDFEAAWPHLLKAKSKGAAVVLVRGPKTDFFKVEPAGVIIHSPPGDADKRASLENPLHTTMDRRHTIYIELVVDGQIVDLNRIPLPANSPIIDERFKDKK
jgi:hypothetical protein